MIAQFKERFQQFLHRTFPRSHDFLMARFDEIERKLTALDEIERKLTVVTGQLQNSYKLPLWSLDVLAHGLIWPNHGQYLQACDEAYQELSLVSNFNEFTVDVPTVVCVARNEEQRLPIFIKHYQKLGVKSIHIIDNNSSDKTAEIARSYASVTLWKADASFERAAHGQAWRGAIVRRHGIGHWVLNLDADELFVYDEMDVKNISHVQDWLISAGIERLYTPMIDIYTDLPLNEGCIIDDKMRLLFDGKIKDGRPPYARQQSLYGADLVGGPRSRMMASIGETSTPWLSKYALARWDAATAYANHHYPYPFDRNPKHYFAALLHLKLLGDFPSRVKNAVIEKQYWNEAADYKSYQRWLTSSLDNKLASDDYSVEYIGPQSLIAAGIIDPAPWRTARHNSGAVSD